MNRMIARDERERIVDLAADRLAVLVLSFGILAIVAWRAFADREASWDLLGLLVLSGIVGTAYRFSRQAASVRLVSVMTVAGLIALVIAIVLAVALPR
jgi:uncharacterized membrane protein HdeD (DUF308 family)